MGWMDAPVIEDKSHLWMSAPEEPSSDVSQFTQPQRNWLARAIEPLPHSFGSGASNAAYNAGGAVTDLASRAGLSPNVAGGAGYVANLGVQMLPMLMGGEVVNQVAGPAMQAGGRRLMQAALKPTIKDLETGKAGRAITTMLEEGRNPTFGGVTAMRQEANALGPTIDVTLAGSPAAVQPTAIASRLQPAIQRAELQVTPTSDVRAIENALEEFLASPRIAGNAEIPVSLANQIKQGTYSSIGGKNYGELSSAATTAQKILAAALREDIGAAVPETVAPMARQAELYNAANVAQRRALMAANNNPVGLAPLANGPMGFLGFLADRSTLVKSLLARMLYSGAPSTGRALGAAISAQSGRAPDQGQ